MAELSVLYASVQELRDFEPEVLEQIEDFFVNYQKVRDVEVRLMGRTDSKAARQNLERATVK